MREYPLLAKALRAMMEERGYSAAALSRKTNIDLSIMHRMLTGRQTSISTRCLMALSQEFSMPIATLIDAFSGEK